MSEEIMQSNEVVDPRYVEAETPEQARSFVNAPESATVTPIGEGRRGRKIYRLERLAA